MKPWAVVAAVFVLAILAVVALFEGLFGTPRARLPERLGPRLQEEEAASAAFPLGRLWRW